MRRIRRAAALLSIASAGALGITAQAGAAQINDVCQVNPGTWYIFITSENYYPVRYPSYVRITGFPDPSDYYAHGNGQPDGSMNRADINQSTCHQ